MISNAIAVRAEHAPYGLLGLAVSKDVRGSHKALERMDWIAAMRELCPKVGDGVIRRLG